MPNKVERAINEIRRLENQFGETTPILVHSDLTVVDEKLNEISASFFDHSKIDVSKGGRLDYLLFNNIVTGCASMGNRALLDLVRPIPDGVPMHDWWLALVAASCGVVGTIAEPTVFYRQHGRNQVGAGPRRARSTLWDARYILQQPPLLKLRLLQTMATVRSWASILLRVAEDEMPRHNREFLRAFCLPLLRDEAAALPWAQRSWLLAKFFLVYVRALPLALRWCY